jgi:chaperonin GroEL (HSP60 family)
MTTTTLVTNEKKTLTRTGTSGFTVTATREGQHLEVLMDFDQATKEEGVAMVATVLTQLEELFGEGYVTACVAHYAADTGKKFMEAGDHQIAMIRGYRRAKKS